METDGTLVLRLRISPETRLIEVASTLMSLTQLLLTQISEDLSPADGESETANESNDFSFGTRFQARWDFPNSN